jgi:hypothetical protein
VNKKKTGLLGLIKPFAIVLILILLHMSACSTAKQGYQISAKVNDSTGSSSWMNSMVTQTLAFKSESAVSGTGNSSKYLTLSDFNGMYIKDAGYTKQGRLIANNTMNVASTVNYIHIQETAHEDSASTIYNAIINASMPTVMYDADELYYRGDGMSTRNSYTNGKDEIKTALSGTTLTKSLVFGSSFTNALVFAELTPHSVWEKTLENRTTAFRIMSAADQNTKFSFKTEDAAMEQNYVGAFQLNTKLIRGDVYHFQNDGDVCTVCGETGYAWLPCCYEGWNEMNPSDQKGFGKSAKSIFDCSACKISK